MPTMLTTTITDGRVTGNSTAYSYANCNMGNKIILTHYVLRCFTYWWEIVYVYEHKLRHEMHFTNGIQGA